MIEACIPKVITIAKRLKQRLPQHVELDDLIQAGCVGLLDAARRYDPTKGASFATFGCKRATGAMLDDLRSMDPFGRVLSKRMRGLVVTEQLTPAQVDQMQAQPNVVPDLVGRRWIRRAVGTLSSRHRRVLLLCYRSTAVIAGASVGVGENRAFQIRDEALGKLRVLAGVAS